MSSLLDPKCAKFAFVSGSYLLRLTLRLFRQKQVGNQFFAHFPAYPGRTEDSSALHLFVVCSHPPHPVVLASDLLVPGVQSCAGPGPGCSAGTQAEGPEGEAASGPVPVQTRLQLVHLHRRPVSVALDLQVGGVLRSSRPADLLGTLV